MSTLYDVTTDPVIQALITEAEADPDLISLVLTGSRVFGAITPESDYDRAFVVPDPVLERYTEQGAPPRGITLHPPVATADLWHVSPRTLCPEHVVAWMRPAWAAARVLYDRTGEVAPIIAALRLMAPETARGGRCLVRHLSEWAVSLTQGLAAMRWEDGWRQPRRPIPCSTCCSPWSGTSDHIAIGSLGALTLSPARLAA